MLFLVNQLFKIYFKVGFKSYKLFCESNSPFFFFFYMMLYIYHFWVQHNFIFFNRSTSSIYVNPWLEQLTAQTWRTNTVWHSELRTDTTLDAKPCLTVTLSKVLCGGKTDLSCCSLSWALAYGVCGSKRVQKVQFCLCWWQQSRAGTNNMSELSRRFQYCL